ALLYLGRTQLSLGGNRDAFATAERLRALAPAGYLQEASPLLTADAAAGAGESSTALAALQQLAEQPGTQSIPTIELKRGRAALATGDGATAIRALSRVYFEYPMSPEAAEAQIVLTGASASVVKPAKETLAAFVGRAERLFAGRQFGGERR